MKDDEKSLGEYEAEYNAAEKEYGKLGGLGVVGKMINRGKQLNDHYDRVDEWKKMSHLEQLKTIRKAGSKSDAVSLYNEVNLHGNDSRVVGGALAAMFRMHRDHSQKPEVKAEKIDRMETMLAESDIGRKSLDVLKKNGYSFDFNYDDVTAPHIDPEHKKVMLNSLWSMETGALSLVHAARTVWQQETGKTPTADLTINAYLARAEVCQADALVTQLAFAEEMAEKNPKILKTFIRNGNEKLYDAYLNKGRDKEAVVDAYKQEKSFRKEDWIKASNHSLEEALNAPENASKFNKNETMNDIKRSVCVNYNDTVYAVGKGEQASFSGMMFRENVKMMVGLPIAAAAFMNRNNRSAESMGLQNVEFKDIHFAKPVFKPTLGIGDTIFEGYTSDQSINLAERCNYLSKVFFKDNAAKKAQKAAVAKMLAERKSR